MTYKQIVLWCLSEISALTGNGSKAALRRKVMLGNMKAEAENHTSWRLL